MRTAYRVLLAVIMLALVALLVPGAVPLAGAEDLPAYEPVSLNGESANVIDYQEKTPYAPHEDAYFTEGLGGYLDDTISVRFDTLRRADTDIWLCWVQIADASQLRTATYKPYPSKSSEMANKIAVREKAVLAINGDFFMDRKEGYIVRNGEELRDNYYEGLDALVVDGDGDFYILRAPTKEKFDTIEGRIVQAFAFGPGLVIDGELQTYFPEGNMKPNSRTQRMALCQMGTLSYLMIATAGPEQKNSQGLTMPELAQLAYDLGAQQAYNLDGGSSTWLVFKGQKVNAPGSKKRPICDIVYFVTSEPEEAAEAVE